MKKNFKNLLKRVPKTTPWVQDILKKKPTTSIYIVGGAVRDTLLDVQAPEIDLVVTGIPAETLQKILEQHGTVHLVGRIFGVFKFSPSDSEEIFDIALPRTEHTLGTGGYRDFDVQSDHTLPIEQDLERRDFTINALALNITTEELVDTTGGLDDIQNKTIRAIGEPEKRFTEDYSRLLRALRFAIKTGFTIETETYKSLKTMITHLGDTHPETGDRLVPYEVIAREFLSSLEANPLALMDLWDESGALKQTIPELLRMQGCEHPPKWHSEGDVWVHTRLAFEKLATPEFALAFPEDVSIDLLLAILFHDLGKPYTQQTPERDGTDRIRFNEHDIRGAKLFADIADRLRFAASEKHTVDVEGITWMIQHHMLLVHGDIAGMKNTTIERYFFSRHPGDTLLKLFWVDAAATIPEDGHNTHENFRAMQKRIAEIVPKNQDTLPPPLIDGHEVMEVLGITKGKKVGEALEHIRELQLEGKLKTKEEAIKLIQEQGRK